VLDALAMEPMKAVELTHQMSVQATG
jgi:hypothetical protein